MVTDEIETFTETGLLLRSGQTLEADIIVTATGFNLNVLGDIEFTIDAEPLNFSETVTYRGRAPKYFSEAQFSGAAFAPKVHHPAGELR